MMGNQPPSHLQRDWQRSLLVCFRVPAHKPTPASLIFTGSVSPCIRFRSLQSKAAARVGTGGSSFSGSALAGSQTTNAAQAVFILFCSGIAGGLIILLRWISTRRKT